MNRQFNTHLEELDLQFRHDLIESRGKFVSLKKGIYSFVKIFFILFFVSFHSGCSNTKVENQLSEAESYIIAHPDSTVSILVGMDTCYMSEKQKSRQELLFLYTQLIYGNQIPIDSSGIVDGDKTLANKFNNDEIKWLIVKSAEAYRSGNPAARILLISK